MNNPETESKPTTPAPSLAGEGLGESPVRSFRAGDHVKHAPTGEEWELACDEERGEVMPSGWPMGIASCNGGKVP